MLMCSCGVVPTTTNEDDEKTGHLRVSAGAQRGRGDGADVPLTVLVMADLALRETGAAPSHVDNDRRPSRYTQRLDQPSVLATRHVYNKILTGNGEG
jgi:hypothetical protein